MLLHIQTHIEQYNSPLLSALLVIAERTVCQSNAVAVQPSHTNDNALHNRRASHYGTNLKTVMRCLTTGIRSEKCVVKRLRHCANVTECTYTNLETWHRLGLLMDESPFRHLFPE